MRPIKHVFKKIIYGERDSLKRSVGGVIIFLNVNKGGDWTYNPDKDHYEDQATGKQSLAYEIMYRL